MCKVLHINRSTYYKVANRVPSARTNETQKLDADIMAIYFATKRRYGAPKIHQELLQQGWHVSLKRVQRRMSVLGIHSIVIKKYRHYSSNKPVAENKIRHSFSRKGCPYDNACIESFHSLIKKEEIYRRIYKDSKEAYKSIFEYIES